MNKQSYVRACEEISEVVNKSGIGSLYQYGSVNHPGISDLDLVICNNKPFCRNTFNDFSARLMRSSNITKQIIGHASIMSVPKNTFGSINIFDSLDLRLISGEQLKIIDYPDAKDLPISFIRLADWSVERLALVNKLQREIDSHSIRYLMCVFNSVGITLNNYAVFSGEPAWGKEYIDSVRCMRDDYVAGYKQDSVKMVREIFAMATELLIKVVEKIARHLYGLQIEKVMRDCNVEIKILLKGRDIIDYVNEQEVCVGDQSIRIPIALGHQWLYIRELASKGHNGANGISVQCTSMQEYARDITSLNQDAHNIMVERLKVARNWLEYKNFHGGSPKVLKYDYFV